MVQPCVCVVLAVGRGLRSLMSKLKVCCGRQTDYDDDDDDDTAGRLADKGGRKVTAIGTRRSSRKWEVGEAIT